MKTILLCGSMKYREKIHQAIAELRRLGFQPVFPDGKSVPAGLSEPDWKAAMAREHYTAMREADAVYFVLPTGYMGTSVILELGYAAALGKPIIFSERTGDVALDHYPQAFVPVENLEKLASFL
jgi:nucleoside 2-deoxyribosyltransferase